MLLPHLFSYQGILDLLELGDTVLADHSFTIDEDVISHGAKLKGTLPICLVKNDGDTHGSNIDKMLVVCSALIYQQVLYLNNMSVIPILFCVTYLNVLYLHAPQFFLHLASINI